LHVVHGSAADADMALAKLNLTHADYILSGIPYTTIPAEIRDVILRKTHSLLHPGGAFLVYQFTRTVLPYLQQVFDSIDQDFEPLNVMPARLFFCRHHNNRTAAANGQNGTKGSARSMPRQPVVLEPTESATPPQSRG
jgi:phospholipid N-methyltransferase